MCIKILHDNKKMKKTEGTRLEVIRGDAHHTSGGKTSKDFKISKSSGEVVSKKKAKQAKGNPWAVATAKARKEMCALPVRDPFHIKEGEMVLFNVGIKGKRLYDITQEHYKKLLK
jgi:hypothetical protein